jgi:hypothetical protein
MPREQINYPGAEMEMDPGTPGSSKVIKVADPALHVSWHQAPAGHVQVAFEADPSYLKIALESPNEDNGRTSMYSPVLERVEINKLIRALRRARDQAYGRDE